MLPISAPIDRAVFFRLVRRENFHGRLKQGQVDGLNAILDYHAAHWPKMIDEELAYVLATAQWESAHTMQPIEEGWPLSGPALRRYQKGLRYFPWFGRGLPQLTWENSYRRWGMIPPERMLEMQNSLRVLFEGMIFGAFRKGHKLADYFSAERQDPVNARLIVNGVPAGQSAPDRAQEIARLYWNYLKALREARQSRESPAAAPPADVIAAQERLVALGYALGRIDGILGEATTGAISEFQFTNDLPVNGRLDAATLDRLMSPRAEPSETAEARRQDTAEDIEGSRTIAAAEDVERGSWGVVAGILAFMVAPDLAGFPAIAQRGLRWLFVIFVLWAVWRAIGASRTVQQARLDDHRSGANLGR